MRIVRVFFLLLFLLSSSTFAVAQSQNPNFLRGVAQFEAQDYRAAQQSFKQAAHESPGNVPINLWLGLSHTALDDGWTSDDIWRAGIGDENWEAAVWALKGLNFWKRGDKAGAIYYFKQAQPIQRGYEVNREMLARISSDGDMPPLSQWPSIVGLSSASGQSSLNSQPGPAMATAQAQPAGSQPQAGRWRGTITNQGGDQTIEFRVSADGSVLSDITFVGYWRCPNATNPTQSTRNAPPDDVAVSGGAFSSTQNDRPSRMWYEFIGRFNSATSATGSLRIAYAGGECDTYKLTWTAARVGP